MVYIGASTPIINCNHELQSCGSHSACTGVGDKDYSSAYRRYKCCSHTCRHFPWSDCHSSFDRHLGCLWHGKKLQLFPHKSHLCKSGGAKIMSITCVACISGHDTTSSSNGKTKKSIWQTVCLWRHHRDICLSRQSSLPAAEYWRWPFQKDRGLTVILYDKTIPLKFVKDPKREVFCHKNRAMDKLPPTNDALLQHVRRAVYQAGI